MENQKEYLSKEKFDELAKELRELETISRREIAYSLEFAKSLGDLSENAEYQEAREAQARVEERIAKIKMIIKNAVIIKSHHSNIVELGSTVIVRKEGSTDSQRLQVVGTEESDISEGKISYQSPIGMALMGKAKGEKVLAKLPKGEIAYHVLNIE